MCILGRVYCVRVHIARMVGVLCNSCTCALFFSSEDQAIFNYRLSRARRIVENSFGILASRYSTNGQVIIETVEILIAFHRWRLFRQPIVAKPSNVVAYAKAAIALHNYLRCTESAVYCPPGYVDGEDGEGNIIRGSWRADGELSSLTSVSRTSSNR